jgi:hypothetical protein
MKILDFIRMDIISFIIIKLKILPLVLYINMIKEELNFESFRIF